MIEYMTRPFRRMLFRFSWWYIKRRHEANPGIARLDELILRMNRRKREPELYKEVNAIMDKIDQDYESLVAQTGGVPQCHTE